jgi:hypothetical protein
MTRPVTSRASIGAPSPSTTEVHDARPGRPARVPMWIAGISLCALAASGTVAIVRSIPASYANILDEGVPSKHQLASSEPEDLHLDDPEARPTVARNSISRRNRVGCPECGFVESVRPIERSGGASGTTIAANALSAKGYEITVRLRDGSSTVFNEANPGTWRLGSRVIVIN